MRRLTKVQIGSELFTIKQRPAFMRRARFEAWKVAHYDENDLLNYYAKPSEIKQAIWRDWCDWATQNGDAYIRVRSANPNFFTIEGLLEYKDKYYVIDITATHNWLFPIEIVEC